MNDNLVVDISRAESLDLAGANEDIAECRPFLQSSVYVALQLWRPMEAMHSHSEVGAMKQRQSANLLFGMEATDLTKGITKRSEEGLAWYHHVIGIESVSDQ